MTDEVDILLYVALSEEFDSVITMLGDGFKSSELSDICSDRLFWHYHVAYP
jgi:hypothetical protein